jgi:hypothetical protein
VSGVFSIEFDFLECDGPICSIALCLMFRSKQASTPSLEAMKAYSLGKKADTQKGAAAALPYNQRAIELDPNFAMGYWAVGGNYFNLGEMCASEEYRSVVVEGSENSLPGL